MKRVLVAGLVGLSVGSTCWSAPAFAAAKPRCHGTTIAVRSRSGKVTCVHRPRVSPQAPRSLSDATARRLATARPHNRRLARLARGRRILPAAGLHAAQAGLTAAQGSIGTTSTAGHATRHNGAWTVLLQWQPLSATAGSMAGTGGGSAQSDATDHGASVQGILTDLAQVAECPTAAGDVPGTSRWRYVLESSSPLPGGGRLVLRSLADATGSIAGHTTSTGMLGTFDLNLGVTVSSSLTAYDRHGRVVAGDPVETESAHVARTGLTPGATAAAILNGATISLGGSIHRTIAQVLGAPDREPLAAGFQQLFPKALAAAATEGGQLLLAAQQAHWQHGDCVIVVLTPGSGALRSGETAGVVAAIRDRHTQPGAPADLSASASSGADESPDSMHLDTGKTGTFTFTAPTGEWTTAGLTVKAVSHQGVGFGVATFHRLLDHYELVYTLSSTGTASYDYNLESSGSMFTNYGHWTENRDVQVSATVPLEAGSDGSYSGSGALHWDRTSWSTEDDNTSNEGQQYPNLCHSKDAEHVSATSDGTLDVTSLKLADQPSLDATLAGIGETWQQSYTVSPGDPCGEENNTYQRQGMLEEAAYEHDQNKDTVNSKHDANGNLVSVEVSFDTGWQPGDGDVVVTRTISGTYPSGPTSAGSVPYTDTFEIVRVSG